ncbi:hypothetical protein [Chelativorans sp. Marseille-P2723]|uniref:capsular polysaccharide export protein, LipB/KpsS family n=1 Tax=Chelativorans sp. Marseille-P2723 TaxID=2709133 RepID=UPI001570E482|nr:hypothetical protein [Chelativorans sp. Marseille-P2723]
MPTLKAEEHSGGDVEGTGQESTGSSLPSEAVHSLKRPYLRLVRMPPAALPAKTRPRVVLLQGPVGPFFTRLQETLENCGFDAWRITFNGGDRLFARDFKKIDFAGTAKEWESWFRPFLAGADVDRIVLFGCARPAHIVAGQLAAEMGVRVLSLEEGYIRPGFVTIEEGGNNAASPVAGKLPPSGETFPAESQLAGRDFNSFASMCLYGAAYYGARSLLSSARERALFHRRFDALREPFLWGRNYWRRVAHRTSDFSIIERLLEHCDRKYFLVPLQVAADSQMSWARGWTNTRLIAETLNAFARTAKGEQRLVFKIHPLERGHDIHRRLIRRTALVLGIAERVDVIETGSLGLLTRHAAGMITINSTSGLSAIHHGVPLLVIGDAIYANPALATCARGKPDFEFFWHNGPVAEKALRHRYLAWLRKMCLRPGDFYARAGIPLACQGVLEKLQDGQDQANSRYDAPRFAC